jgi:hypothetical protein
MTAVRSPNTTAERRRNEVGVSGSNDSDISSAPRQDFAWWSVSMTAEGAVERTAVANPRMLQTVEEGRDDDRRGRCGPGGAADSDGEDRPRGLTFLLRCRSTAG